MKRNLLVLAITTASLTCSCQLLENDFSRLQIRTEQAAYLLEDRAVVHTLNLTGEDLRIQICYGSTPVYSIEKKVNDQWKGVSGIPCPDILTFAALEAGGTRTDTLYLGQHRGHVGASPDPYRFRFSFRDLDSEVGRVHEEEAISNPFMVSE